ncbi:unnamed protein product [Spirodela intermedia]|uniref:Epidermal patterning factor-like protein n=1 Tax=Spirodela intermedia TaxID=51605 RepID=A0A7I8JB75_SPIIN|nr:unnamed protein product [Spirodela intermedia]CAA6667456.1 unnamed protein product [Spirodela intermedia]
MGFCCWRGIGHPSNPLPLVCLWFLLFCSSHTGFLAQGKRKVTVRALIGSRPPLCERRCRACGHCEPVQVPAVPQARAGGGRFPAALAYRGDDGSSNYKPVSWKCKCGNLIMNP